METENIIIGGGLAGLLTAWYMEQKGLPYILLEAKAQLGGRILGIKDSQEEHYHDLGPTWIFPHQCNIQSLLDELTIPYFEQYIQGDALFQKQGDQNALRTAGAGGMEMYRVQGGMTTIVNTLSRKLKPSQVKTAHVVKYIIQTDEIWHINAAHNEAKVTFKAKNLILALPPRMITKHLTPENWASSSLIQALQHVPTWMAAQAKFVATYETPFWRELGLSGEVFSQQGPMQEMHDACAENKIVSALFGFIGVPATYRANYDESQIKQACINQLSQLYGKPAQSIKASYLKDWANDEFVASGNDINEPPNHPHFAIANHENELTQKNIYLAGSEFSQVDAGYLEGAVCAVAEVINKLTFN